MPHRTLEQPAPTIAKRFLVFLETPHKKSEKGLYVLLGIVNTMGCDCEFHYDQVNVTSFIITK